MPNATSNPCGEDVRFWDPLLNATHVSVTYHGRLVGTIAQPSRREPTYFQYDPSWLSAGFSISPLSLPLGPRVYRADVTRFSGLPAIFDDSLPDDWGRLLVQRRLASAGIDSSRLSPLARLMLVGSDGLGALEYSPAVDLPAQVGGIDYDELAERSRQLILDENPTGLDQLYAFGSSSGGARPKVMVDIDGEAWIVKFPAPGDPTTSGADEFRLLGLASACGIRVPATRLIPSARGGGYLASRRFDRICRDDGTIGKVHMASAAALLEASPFDEGLDYRDLMRLTLRLTADARDCDQLFLVMCFNVAIGNCDDHFRNFSFLYDEHDGAWHLAPAYDLTRSPGFLGEHTTLVNGRGSQIRDEDLIVVGRSGGLTCKRCLELIARVRDVTGTIS